MLSLNYSVQIIPKNPNACLICTGMCCYTEGRTKEPITQREYSIIGHLEHLAEIYLGQTSETGNVDLFYSLTRALDMNADKMVVELTFVKQLVENAIHREGNREKICLPMAANSCFDNSGIPVAEGMEHLEYQYLLPLGQLITETKSSKLTAK